MAGTPEAYVLSHRAGWGTEFQGSRPYDQGKLFQGTQEHVPVGPGVRWQPAPSHPLLQAPVALPPRLATTPLPDPIPSQASATSSPWGPVTWASACRTQRCPLRPRLGPHASPPAPPEPGWAHRSLCRCPSPADAPPWPEGPFQTAGLVWGPTQSPMTSPAHRKAQGRGRPVGKRARCAKWPQMPKEPTGQERGSQAQSVGERVWGSPQQKRSPRTLHPAPHTATGRSHLLTGRLRGGQRGQTPGDSGATASQGNIKGDLPQGENSRDPVTARSSPGGGGQGGVPVRPGVAMAGQLSHGVLTSCTV